MHKHELMVLLCPPFNNGDLSKAFIRRTQLFEALGMLGAEKSLVPSKATQSNSQKKWSYLLVPI